MWVFQVLNITIADKDNIFYEDEKYRLEYTFSGIMGQAPPILVVKKGWFEYTEETSIHPWYGMPDSVKIKENKDKTITIYYYHRSHITDTLTSPVILKMHPRH